MKFGFDWLCGFGKMNNVDDRDDRAWVYYMLAF